MNSKLRIPLCWKELLVYKNEWLAYDANIDSHSGLRQEEESHNLVRIESGGQTVHMRESAPPSMLKALHDEAAFSYFAADTAPIYGGAAPVQAVERAIVFVKPNVFVVLDRVKTSATAARRVFQLNAPVRPTVAGGKVTIQGTKSKLDLIPLLPAGATPAVVDLKTFDATDFNGGFRVEIPQTGVDTAVFLNVLSLDGAVTAQTLAPATGQTGVALTLADGRKVTVHFTDTQPGGSLDIMTGTQTMTYPLSAGVTSYPVLAP